MLSYLLSYFFFFFNDTATTEIYTLSLHDALPIFTQPPQLAFLQDPVQVNQYDQPAMQLAHAGHVVEFALVKYRRQLDRKSTRLNSSHMSISYAVFCLKKKKHN